LCIKIQYNLYYRLPAWWVYLSGSLPLLIYLVYSCMFVLCFFVANNLSLGVYAPTGSVWPTFQVEGVVPTNHSSCQKTRTNDLLIFHCIRKWTQVYFVLSQCTRLTDRQTDRQKCLRYTVQCSKYCTLQTSRCWTNHSRLIFVWKPLFHGRTR